MAHSSQTYQQRQKAAGLGPKVRHRSPSETNRLTANQRGYDYAWQKYRLVYLVKHPLCVVCLIAGILMSATIVDHIIPHKGNRVLFLDPANHQSMCVTCHNVKTATEDGAFGRPVKAMGKGGVA